MEIWFIIVVSVSLSLFLNSIFNLFSYDKKPISSFRLPPGPHTFPIIGNIKWLRKGVSEIEPILRSLHSRLGPMVTLRIGTSRAIFVADRTLAHQALVQNGAVFADRPPPLATSKILSSNQHNISSAGYGPTWRLLRRNITSEILHPSRMKSYSRARKWVLGILIDRLGQQHGEPVRAVDHLHHAMFCLLVLMCFGDRLEEKQIKQVEFVQRRLLLSFRRFEILNFWPKITKILLWKRWGEFLQIQKEQADVLLPLIRSRRKILEEKGRLTKENNDIEDEQDYVLAYVDTLINLELPDEKRNVNEEEMMSLCSEFLSAGTDTTATALQWILANLVKYPNIQEKLYEEIKGIAGENETLDEISEEDVKKMPYLKAVVLEGLRRHPPGHFVLPHSVTDDTILGGYLLPKNGTINFMVAEMGWDPDMWEDPMAYKPERFTRDGGGETVDITGSRGIKMMPFGAGRRICPGLGLAMLHLEYFVANLVWKFEWKAVEGDEVDLSEKQEFTMVMKHPLKACVLPRMETKA